MNVDDRAGDEYNRDDPTCPRECTTPGEGVSLAETLEERLAHDECVDEPGAEQILAHASNATVREGLRLPLDSIRRGKQARGVASARC